MNWNPPPNPGMPWACVMPRMDMTYRDGCVSCQAWVEKGKSCWVKTYYPGTSRDRWHRMCEICFWCKVVTDELWDQPHNPEARNQAAEKLKEVADLLVANRTRPAYGLKIVNKAEYKALKRDPIT